MKQCLPDQIHSPKTTNRYECNGREKNHDVALY